MNLILHITTRAAWEQAKQAGEYRADTLDSEGFIHCSTPQQLIWVADTFYRGRQDLLLLCIAPELLRSELRYEALQTSASFPHIYGPLNTNAVIDVLPFPPRADGTFELPVLPG